MCPFVSIAALWLCVLYVLVHNNKRVEQTVLVQTYTKDSDAKNSCSEGVWGQGFRIWQLVIRITSFFVYARLKREKLAGKNLIYLNFCQLAPIESTDIEHPNDI